MEVPTHRTVLDTVLVVLVTIAAFGWAIAYCFRLNGYNLAVQDASTALFVVCCVFETVRALVKQRHKK